MKELRVTLDVIKRYPSELDDVAWLDQDGQEWDFITSDWENDSRVMVNVKTGEQVLFTKHEKIWLHPITKMWEAHQFWTGVSNGTQERKGS